LGSCRKKLRLETGCRIGATLQGPQNLQSYPLIATPLRHALDEQNHKQHETDPCGQSQEGKFIGHLFSISLRASAEALLRASRAENGPDGCRVGCLAEQQERSARLAQRPPISKRTTHPAVRSELCRAPTGPRSPIGPRSKDAGGLDSRQPLPAQGVGGCTGPDFGNQNENPAAISLRISVSLSLCCGHKCEYGCK
jgi:hypothetical protein